MTMSRGQMSPTSQRSGRREPCTPTVLLQRPTAETANLLNNVPSLKIKIYLDRRNYGQEGGFPEAGLIHCAPDMLIAISPNESKSTVGFGGMHLCSPSLN